MAKQLSKKGQEKFEWLLTRYPKPRAALLPLLRIIESEFGCIDNDGIALAAERIGMSPAEVYSVLTFYTHYKREADGKYVIWVCNTLPCALRGATKLTEVLKSKLGVDCWETTADKRFTLKKAECLASCDTAPCMQIDDDHFDCVDEDQVDEILARYV